jgi:hypothetical protein
MTANIIKKETITFANNNEANAVFPLATSKAEDIVKTLDLKQYKAVILILGGASDVDQALIPRLTQLFGRGIARAAAEADAIIVDGGTQAGVMAMMGEGIAGRGYSTMLVGVAPANKVMYPGGPDSGVPLEPNHTHFVLVDGTDWGSETTTIYGLISYLSSAETQAANVQRKPALTTNVQQKPAQAANVQRKPALAVLANGGAVSTDEVLRAVRQKLPLIVVEGSGGLADKVAAAWKQKDTLPDDPVMAEIIADGDIHIHLLSNSVKGIERLIIRELGVDQVLMEAWETFADYDLNAGLQQKRFSGLQLSIIIIGVLGTALAIVKQRYFAEPPEPVILYQVLIVIPILLTVLITAANRFKQGSKWLLLRAGAESIKREIYKYRTRSLDYKTEPEHQLSQRVEDITRRTMRTDVNLSAILPYKKDNGLPPKMYGASGVDDGLSYLTPDRYVEVRLGDQLSYFKKKTVKLDRQLKALYWLTFVIGGLGTYLSAIGQQVWIALTTAIVAAIGTYLGYRQTESTLTKYNQAATDLSNVKTWWEALSAEEQSLQENIDSLVEHTEQVLQSELDGWVQQMQDALAELRKGQEPAQEREQKREPQEQPKKPEENQEQQQDAQKEEKEEPQQPAPPDPEHPSEQSGNDGTKGEADSEEKTGASQESTGDSDEETTPTPDETPTQPTGMGGEPGTEDGKAADDPDKDSSSSTNGQGKKP